MAYFNFTVFSHKGKAGTDQKKMIINKIQRIHGISCKPCIAVPADYINPNYIKSIGQESMMTGADLLQLHRLTQK